MGLSAKSMLHSTSFQIRLRFCLLGCRFGLGLGALGLSELGSRALRGCRGFWGFAPFGFGVSALGFFRGFRGLGV